MTEFAIPTAGSQPWGITAGPDGNVWFTESFGNKIGRITPAGVITEFPIPTTGSRPSGSRPARTATSGSPSRAATRSAGSPPRASSPSSRCPLPAAARANITAGPDGNLWFTESAATATRSAGSPPPA